MAMQANILAGKRIGVFLHARRYWFAIILFWAVIGALSFSLRQHQFLDNTARMIDFEAKMLSQSILAAHVQTSKKFSASDSPLNYLLSLNQTPKGQATEPAAKAKYRVVADLQGGSLPHPNKHEREMLHDPDYVHNGVFLLDLDGPSPVAEHLTPIVTTDACLSCHSGHIYKPGAVQAGIITTLQIDEIANNYKNFRANNIFVEASVASILAASSLVVFQLFKRRDAKLMMATEQMLEYEKMVAVGMMVAGFSHELGTPIGIAVAANSQISEVVHDFEGLLNRDEVSEEEITEPLTVLKDSYQLISTHLERAHKMIKQFKHTTNDLSYDDKTTFAFREVFNDILIDMKHLHKNRNIRIEVSYPPELSIHASASAFKQVMYNLYDNAMKYAFLDGSLQGAITIDCYVVNNIIKVIFQDDGCGMDKDILKHIFEPFRTTGRQRGGMGLGMYITYELVTKQLHGTIKCSTRPGKGTLFEILLPHAPPPTATKMGADS
jgi:signal transduction histidine kinase